VASWTPRPPAWFDPAVDYSSPELRFAWELGRTAGLASCKSWAELESLIQSVWRTLPNQPSWERARGAIYSSWRRVYHPTA
jgi:hypothetical protein